MKTNKAYETLNKDKKELEKNVKSYHNHLMGMNKEIEDLKQSLQFNSVPQADLFKGLEPSSPFLQSSATSQAMYLNIRQQMLDSKNEGSDFFSYLLVLERATYFENRVIFKGDDKIVFYLYKAMYFGSLNGRVGINQTPKGYRLFNPEKVNYDEYGELTSVSGSLINIHNSDDWEQKTQRFIAENTVIYNFNQNLFGLWVLCYWYVKSVSNMFELLNKQGNYLNKKLILESKNTQLLSTQIANSFLDQSPILSIPMGSKVSAADFPEVDMDVFFSLIENFQNYMDYHILGIRTVQSDNNSTSRDIVANQGTKSAYIDKAEKGYNFGIHKFINEINEKFNLDIDWEDRNIEFSDGLKQSSNTVDKISEGAKGHE